MSKTPASVFSHPIHPMLVAVPIGLWVFSFVCDLIFLGTHHSPIWSTIAWYAMAGGIVGALAAAVPGFIDWLSLTPNSRAKTVGAYHLAVNLLIVVLYAVNVGWRLNRTDVSAGPIVMSLVLVILLAVSGWLGGELVYRHNVGVSGSE